MIEVKTRPTLNWYPARIALKDVRYITVLFVRSVALFLHQVE